MDAALFFGTGAGDYRAVESSCGGFGHCLLDFAACGAFPQTCRAKVLHVDSSMLSC